MRPVRWLLCVAAVVGCNKSNRVPPSAALSAAEREAAAASAGNRPVGGTGQADSAESDGITCVNHWGRIAAPVTGTSEAAPYAGAELFPGPAKFGADYFAGVLPNGRIVKPAGKSGQIGMNPLGAALTPDGKFLITTNDDERPDDRKLKSLHNPTNVSGYSISVVDTASMQVVSTTATSGRFFVGILATGAGPYTVYVSGGADNNVKVFSVSKAGAISTSPASSIAIAPTHPANAGYVNHYAPGAPLDKADASGNKPPIPTGFGSRTAPTRITFPAGMAASPDGRYLYVACNGDNSLAIIDTTTKAVVKQIPVGFFPYGVSVNADGKKVYVSNWGLSEYKFKAPTYDAGGKLIAIGFANTTPNQPDGFYVPVTDPARSSSLAVVDVPDGNPGAARVQATLPLGKPLDENVQVGGTHPSAVALVGGAVYVAQANDDSIAIVAPDGSRMRSFKLAPGSNGACTGERLDLRGTYPNAIAVSPDGRRAYVAEAGINAVAVLDTTHPLEPKLLGRIPTGWYPSALTVSADGHSLYVINAKGVGEDINPNAPNNSIESFTDGNFIFGTAQRVDLTRPIDQTTALSYNFTRQEHLDTSVVPDTVGERSPKIKHVIFILHENKTFDSMLGNLAAFGPFASTSFFNPDGSAHGDPQFTVVSWNTQSIAAKFATGVNYYSDAEESDAGHQFAASGTATDYTEKTLLVKSGRGLLVNKNFEPEDYPASGYIFNNLARHGRSFKNYGAMIRIDGTDTGTSTPASLNDPGSGDAGYPKNATPTNPDDVGDVTTRVSGLGQSYFLQLPILAVLGGNNPGGEPRTDRNYPGYNFNISDQRRALEFIQDFDRMVKAGTLPEFIYLYQPNDHTGSQQAKNVPAATAAQQVADGDVALGMVVQHVMKSPVYYDAGTDSGAAIFVTYDDAQSTADHIHEHRTPVVVVSPFAKPAYAAKRHYSTASIVKTEELLLGLPPNNLGDLLATDMREFFQPAYNGITAADLSFSTTVAADYKSTPLGRRIWKMAARLDTSAPDRDSRRLGLLARLSMAGDRLYRSARGTRGYREKEQRLLALARNVVRSPGRDADD